MNNKTERFLMLMFLVALVYVCTNCVMSFIDFNGRPAKIDVQCQTASTDSLKQIIIPKMSFSSSNTLADAISFFNAASKQHSLDGKGINFMLKTEEAIPALSKIQAQSISLHDALKLCCDQTGYAFEMKDNIVVVHKR